MPRSRPRVVVLTRSSGCKLFLNGCLCCSWGACFYFGESPEGGGGPLGMPPGWRTHGRVPDLTPPSPRSFPRAAPYSPPSPLFLPPPRPLSVSPVLSRRSRRTTWFFSLSLLVETFPPTAPPIFSRPAAWVASLAVLTTAGKSPGTYFPSPSSLFYGSFALNSVNAEMMLDRVKATYDSQAGSNPRGDFRLTFRNRFIVWFHGRASYNADNLC